MGQPEKRKLILHITDLSFFSMKTILSTVFPTQWAGCIVYFTETLFSLNYSSFFHLNLPWKSFTLQFWQDTVWRSPFLSWTLLLVGSVSPPVSVSILTLYVVQVKKFCFCQNCHFSCFPPFSLVSLPVSEPHHSPSHWPEVHRLSWTPSSSFIHISNQSLATSLNSWIFAKQCYLIYNFYSFIYLFWPTWRI